MAPPPSSSSSSIPPPTFAGIHNVCFNSTCKLLLSSSRKGWRRRTGDFVDLCDRCSSAYEQGNFCETFHLNSSGWRCCESCGKQIHCGCIVSFHTFVLLDAGGIECITCARKSFILTPNPAWPPSSVLVPQQPERIKDSSGRNWSPIAGSGPVPWRQAPSMFNATSQTELQVDGLCFSERLPSSSMEKRKLEDSLDRLMNRSLKISCLEVQRANVEEQPSCFLNQSQKTTQSVFSLVAASTSKTETDGQRMVAETPYGPTQSTQYCIQNQVDVSEAKIRYSKARGDAKERSQLLRRYRPRISEEELQKFAEHSNSVITPLFEKPLSASDAGKIGRLVVPKQCAEAYFPPISQPEGMPLKIVDSNGNEWVFHFRFWPNNNSRMYVLEGINPCIQSMHLQAGDIVTFSRIEPQGKLGMGCRKVSAASPEKEYETPNAAPKSSSNGESVAKGNKADGSAEYIELPQTNLPRTGYASSFSLFPLNQQTLESKPGHVGDKANASVGRKKKNENGTVGLRRKRLKIDNEDAVELKVTWEQVQGLFRPPPNKDPTVNVIDGCEFEEFNERDAPVIGRPTIPASDGDGKRIQWIQCEKCFKWRKVPVDALLKSKWTCSDNFWDTARSVCSAVEELTSDKLDEALLPAMNYATSERMKDPLQQGLETVEGLEGLDALADLAEEEKATSSQSSRTKHPRHKSGCACIVCLQPPSGKGPKHSQPCDCAVCDCQKRRFETLKQKRGQKQSGKGAERGRHSFEDDSKISRNGGSSREEQGSSDNNGDQQSQASSLKGHIDLNIQPDREEEVSTAFHSSGTKDRLQSLPTYIRNSSEATLETMERNQRQQKLLECVKGSVTNKAQLDGIGHTQTGNSMKLEDDHIVHPCISSFKGVMTSTTPDEN